MKFLIVFVAVIMTAMCMPIGQVEVTQDSLGNYKISMDAPGYKKFEERHADGSVSGSYSYVDPSGVERSIMYTSGKDGFQILGGNMIPLQVTDTPEVAAARAVHLELLRNSA